MGENRQKNFQSGKGILRSVLWTNRTESTGTKRSAERDIRLSALLLPGRWEATVPVTAGLVFHFLKFKESGGQAYGKARQTAGLPENVSGGQRRSDRSIEGNREKNTV